MKLREELIIHENLNPKLFSKNDELLPEVKSKILSIVDEFLEYSELDIDVADVQLVGSNASYNYSENSDLDVHIITNFELYDASEEILQALYNSKKTIFNDKFNIKIRGIDVELYVQDINSGIQSNGIYSVIENAWIKFPKKISVKTYNFQNQLSQWQSKVQSVIQNGSDEEIRKLIDQIYLIRHNSLATDGEYSKGNQLFKEIRNAGLIDALKDALTSEMSNKLSLEGLSTSQILSKNY